jgi:hypothetical protein
MTVAPIQVPIMDASGRMSREWVLFFQRWNDNGTAQIFTPNTLIIPLSQTLTIASGVVTATGSYHTVDTEGAAASDDLDTINGGTTDGQVLILKTLASSRDVTVKDATGNIRLAGDCVLGSFNDQICLVYSASGSRWLELSRSING